MITVRFYGTLRLKTEAPFTEVEAATVGEALKAVAAKGKVTEKELRQCIALLRGLRVNRRKKLEPGDELMLLSPVGGG